MVGFSRRLSRKQRDACFGGIACERLSLSPHAPAVTNKTADGRRHDEILLRRVCDERALRSADCWWGDHGYSWEAADQTGPSQPRGTSTASRFYGCVATFRSKTDFAADVLHNNPL